VLSAMLISLCVFDHLSYKNTKVVSIATTNIYVRIHSLTFHYRGADKSLAQPNSRCILFDGENISFDASLFIYINSINIPPFMIINNSYEHQNPLSL
jgi:hypothetical protein